jgi:MFS family permease
VSTASYHAIRLVRGALADVDQILSIWGMSEDEVNHSQVGNVFMLGAGGVVAVALSAYFGRYPVLFWFITLALATSAWCAGATTFESFMAARILNGFFSTVAQGASTQSYLSSISTFDANNQSRVV